MASLRKNLHQRITDVLQMTQKDYDISLRAYGWNALTGQTPEKGTPPPREVGMMLVVTAETQKKATKIAKVCNPYFFHFPLNVEKPLPSFGFPFSPAEVERGEIYEFKLNHIVETESPFELVRTEIINLKNT